MVAPGAGSVPPPSGPPICKPQRRSRPI